MKQADPATHAKLDFLQELIPTLLTASNALPVQFPPEA